MFATLEVIEWNLFSSDTLRHENINYDETNIYIAVM